MAAGDRVNLMNADLDILEAEIADLPGLAAEWQEESPLNQASTRWDWWDLMGRLEAISEADRGGGLSPDEAERFRALVGAIRRLAPVLERLDLPVPDLVRRAD